jgi:hypothetical protein
MIFSYIQCIPAYCSGMASRLYLFGQVVFHLYT